MFNSRHPGPRRVWKGGSEQQLMTPDPVDPLDPVDPVDSGRSGDEFHLAQIDWQARYLRARCRSRASPSPSKTYTFETISDISPS